MVTVFVVVGVLGVGMLLIALLLGDVLDGLLDSLDLTGGVLSTEVVGAFLAAFGFAGALLAAGLSVPLGLAAAGGALAGLVTGGVALLLSRAFLRMPTDATLTSGDLGGRIARVITRIPDGGFGEVSVTVGGHRMKLSARAEHPIPEGTDVVIVAAASPTSVIVTDAGI